MQAIKPSDLKINKDGSISIPKWLQEYLAKPWGPKAVKLSQTRKGRAFAIYNEGVRQYIDGDDYLVDWFGAPMQMSEKIFKELFEKHGTTKKKNIDS